MMVPSYADTLNRITNSKYAVNERHQPTSHSDFNSDDFVNLSQRKPTAKQPILIRDKGNIIYEGQFTGITFKSDDGKIINNVVGWRPRAIKCAKCGSAPVLKDTKRGGVVFTCSNSTDACNNAKPTNEILNCIAFNKFDAINKWNDLMRKQISRGD